MGSSVSVTNDFEAVNQGGVKALYDNFLPPEDQQKLDRLQRDLIEFQQVREALAEFVLSRAKDTPDEVLNSILSIDEDFMNELLSQGTKDDATEEVSDGILYYMNIFVNSSEYDEIYERVVTPCVTPLTLLTPQISSF